MRRNRRGRRRYFEDDDVNPMEGLSNLSDAMLILAVGIMIALILHWNVDWSGASENASNQNGINLDNAIEFDASDMENISSNETVSGDDMTQLGIVYYDESTDSYYIIEDN